MQHLPASSVLAAAAYLVGSAGSVVFVSRRVARVVARDDRVLCALVGTLLGIAQAVGVPLMLGMIGILSRTPALLAHLVLAGLVAAMIREKTEPTEARPWTPLGLA